MNLLILGRGKTGSTVAEVAQARRHHVRVLSSNENAGCRGLAADALAGTDLVIDFTRREVHRQTETVHLTKIEFDLLRVLVTHADKVLTDPSVREVYLGNRA